MTALIGRICRRPVPRKRATTAEQWVPAQDTVSQLERARTAEASYGNSRKTVLQAIDRRLGAVRGTD